MLFDSCELMLGGWLGSGSDFVGWGMLRKTTSLGSGNGTESMSVRRVNMKSVHGFYNMLP